MVLPTVVEWSHWIIRRVLRAGDIAFDATVGHGYDLIMMARCVAPNGLVLGCDIQRRAIESSQQRAEEHGLSSLVRLHQQSHERIAQITAAEGVHSFRAIMYNLGYLPGGDKAIRTRRETTIPSLGCALELLESGGVMTIVSYRGHEGGVEEANAVVKWCRALPPNEFECMEYSSLQSESAPLGIAVARRTIR